MYLTRLQIENIKGFKDGPLKIDLDLTRPGASPAGWTVLAGRNGSGKTTFLKAIALAIAGPTAARALQESFAGWVREGSSVARVAALISHDDNHDEFEKTGRQPAEFWTGLQWKSSGKSEPSLSDYHPESTRQTPRRGPWADDPRGWFVVGYGPFRRLTGHASDAQRLMVGPHHVPRLVSLFREDASLIECVQWLKDLYLRRLEQKPGAQELETATLRLLNDGMLPGDMKVDHVDSDGLWVRQAGTVLPLKDLSDGYRTMIALVLDILRHMQTCYKRIPITTSETGTLSVELPGIVMIDEVDVHLHITWQQRIGFWLKQRFPKIQFLVSSHSPYLCQAADLGGLIRLPAPGEQRTAERVKDVLHRRIIRGTADEAALSELFGLDNTRSREAQDMIKHLAMLEAKIARGTASTTEKQQYAALQLELPLSPTGEVAQELRSLRTPPAQ